MRLRQIKRLVKEVGEAATAEFSIEWLIPYMKRKVYEKGSKIFSKGDQANEMLYVQSGRILLTEIDGLGEALGIEPGTVIGEVGVFAPNRKCTATATAADDPVVYSVDEEGIIQLYCLNPKFAFYLVKLITQRLIENNDRAMSYK
jgi:CRP-like cAMP-binding protein